MGSLLNWTGGQNGAATRGEHKIPYHIAGAHDEDEASNQCMDVALRIHICAMLVYSSHSHSHSVQSG